MSEYILSNYDFKKRAFAKVCKYEKLLEYFQTGHGACDYDLVTGPYGVSDAALSASSTHSTCRIQHVRFNSSRGWCPVDTEDGHYVQVEFQTTSNLKAVQTLGRGDLDQWVSLYSVNISMDGINWNSILSYGDVKVFPGNTDSHTLVTNTLAENVFAKSIRIISVSGKSYRSMRLEVKGCPVANMLSTCNKWTERLGSAGDVFSVLEETNAANHIWCGRMCSRQWGCDSFVFYFGSNNCKLLKSTSDIIYTYCTTMDLENVWYYIQI
ncbi:contactin-associated protein-like 2 [Argopecten irradians]|uniref:contactin-associated protein-like 2 n=1 Tax=Argopecten irradians TaxID=31199 RepID=UPI00371B6AD0